MYWHPERKLCFLAHPRTASSATANALLGVGFKRYPGQRHHDGIPEGLDREGYRIFCTVRDVRDTVVSWMFFLQQEPPFTVEDLHREAIEKRFGGYVREGRLWWFLEDADQFHLYENLEDDLGTELWIAGLQRQRRPLSLGRVNVGERRNGRPWQDFLDAEAQAWVARTFAKDIAETGGRPLTCDNLSRYVG